MVKIKHPGKKLNGMRSIYDYLSLSGKYAETLKNNDAEQVKFESFPGSIATVDYFYFVWKHFIEPIKDKKYDKIGEGADQNALFVLRETLSKSHNVIDMFLYNVLQTSINIGFLHLQKYVSDNKMKVLEKKIDDQNKLISKLQDVKESAGNADINAIFKMAPVNLNKYTAKLNLEIGLFMYYYGYNPERAHSGEFNHLRLIIKSLENTMHNGVRLTRKYLQKELERVVDADNEGVHIPYVFDEYFLT